ncbi:ABC transporter permease [Nocardioides sp. YIM 152315]|uniref:ABC transporter permease n=1 Tax=Nocardioides sp. YIM 152315 TaxID=3031760 RepID=UPI0023DBF568|nr:ABC transporter permease [Nocardioides sp. YIM 152315]MDF1606430.1 ABC transporter permease [Nocardioides sp. YIM 152315]
MVADAHHLGHAIDISSTSPTPFWRLVRVELRKSYDTRAGFWLLAVIGLIVLAAEIIVLAVVTTQDESIALGDFVAVAAFLTSFLLPVLGIMVLTTEWSQRTAMVTFALEPRRPLVIAAKALVGVLLTLATVAVSIVIGAVCNALYGVIEGSADWTFGWSDFWAFLLTQVLAMLGGFALAALLLNTPAAIVVFFVYKWVLPGLFELGAQLVGWFGDLRPWLDFQSAQNAIWEWSSSGEDWANLVVSGVVWLGLPLAFGIWRVLRAEVK